MFTQQINLKKPMNRAMEALDGVDLDILSEKVKTGMSDAQNRVRDYTNSVVSYSKGNPWTVVFSLVGVAALCAAVVYRDDILAAFKPYMKRFASTAESAAEELF